MARVKFSAVISEVRGSVGSGTFQNFKGGTILRNKPIPKQTWTLDNYYSRLFTQLAQQAWAGLTADEQANWNSFLDFAPAYQKNNKYVQLSGFNLFLKYNILRQHCGFAILTTFDYESLASLNLVPSIYLDTGVLYVNFNQVFSSDTSFILFKLSPVLKTPNASKRSRLRKIPLGSFTPPGVDTFNITSYYFDRYGVVPADGDKLLCGITFMSAVAPIVEKEVYFNVEIFTV